ncbi:hypothetical protein C8Q78DRAFT_450932 [Trametes maxima]|nr:hypothetical protein C8Q78DRAFT_450932 [Trametes maxima]
MSVAYVKNHPAAVTVADEIESFFHVLLFYAVRILNHNIELVPAFVVDYFDTHAHKKDRGQRACSRLKTSTMHNGVLDNNGTTIHFYVDSANKIHAAFETLLATLLRFFRARYEVAKWSEHVKVMERSQSAPSKEGSVSSSHPFQREAPPTSDLLDFIADEPASAQEPSDVTKSMAARLDDHPVILSVILHCLNASVKLGDGSSGVKWPKADVVTDRLSDSGYDPRPHILALGELQKNIEAHTSTHVDGPPPFKKIKTSASGSIEPQTVQRSTDRDSSRGTRKKRSRKGKARA